MTRLRRACLLGALGVAACASATATTATTAALGPPPATHEVPTRLRAPLGLGRSEVQLIASGTLPDGSAVVLGQGLRDGRGCDRGDRAPFISGIRADGTHDTRCAGALTNKRFVIGPDGDLWALRQRESYDRSGAHGDLHDVDILEHFDRDGALLTSRVLTQIHVPNSAAGYGQIGIELGVTALQVAADGELIVAGIGPAGGLVGDHWERSADVYARVGFVLGLRSDSDAPPRVITMLPGVQPRGLAISARRFAVVGSCVERRDETTPALAQCPRYGGDAVVVDGALDGSGAVHAVAIGGDGYAFPHVALTSDDAVVVAGNSFRPLLLDGKPIPSNCGQSAFVAEWNPDHSLRYARSLGDCKQPHVSPLARGGVSTSAADDDLADFTVAVTDLALLGDDPIVALRIGQETNRLRWPVRFDGVAVETPEGADGLVVRLDHDGHVAAHQRLRFLRRPEHADQPSVVDANETVVGVQAIQLAVDAATSTVWIVAQHEGSLATSWGSLLVGSRAIFGNEERFPTEAACRKARGQGRRRAARDGLVAMEPPPPPCMRHLLVETAIDVLPWVLP